MTVGKVRPQESARLGMLHLEQNTNVLGPNPAVAKARLAEHDLSVYPEPHSESLTRALAERHGIDPLSIVVTRGSDEALDLAVRAFAVPKGRLAYPEPSFERYAMLGPAYALPHTPLRLRGRLEVDVDGLLAARAALTLVANPNNPTGARIPSGELERLVREARGHVVVDEAYIEYAGQRHTLLPLLESARNLVVLRTFSKAHGLAGLRVGWAAAHPETAKALRATKAPFNVDTPGQRTAELALAEQAWLEQCVETVRGERDRLVAALARRGCRAHPSEANFVLVRVPADAGAIANTMRQRGVLVRAYPDGQLAGHLRITVGGPAHTDATLTALDAALEAHAPTPESA